MTRRTDSTRTAARPRRAALGLAAALASGCLLRNPAYDEATGAASEAATGAGTTTGTTGATTGSSGEATQSASGETIADTTGGASAGTTVAPTCGAEDEPCVDGACCGDCLVCDAGLCVPQPALCGECRACVAGSCALAPGSACELPDEQRCENFLYGAKLDGCYAFKPAPGVCDAAGLCTQSCSEPADAAIVACDEPCAKAGDCATWTPVARFDAGGYCIPDGPAEGCQPRCVDSAQASAMTFQVCQAGKCVDTMADMGCGLYTCNAAKTACLNVCTGEDDCVFSATCDLVKKQCL